MHAGLKNEMKYITNVLLLQSFRIQDTCTQQIVFVKTHKTAGSTVAAIIQRFGMARDLSFVTPKRRNYNTFTGFEQFNRNYVFRYTEVQNLFGSFNILATHAIYNRPEMEAVVRDPVFLTILRHPVQQFLSAFYYYNFTYQMGLQGSSNPVMEFLIKPESYVKSAEYGKHQLRNGQLYDLGINLAERQMTDAGLQNRVKSLEKELDLVMITEYIDESLILLKKLLCWSFEDILYIPLRVNPEKDSNPAFVYDVNLETSLNIENFNQEDMKLYQHFNVTFWKKVEGYGPDFLRDLKNFKKLLSRLWERCNNHPSVVNYTYHFEDWDMDRLLHEKPCSEYFRMDDDNTRIVRDRLRQRLDSRCRRNCKIETSK